MPTLPAVSIAPSPGKQTSHPAWRRFVRHEGIQVEAPSTGSRRIHPREPQHRDSAVRVVQLDALAAEALLIAEAGRPEGPEAVGAEVGAVEGRGDLDA